MLIKEQSKLRWCRMKINTESRIKQEKTYSSQKPYIVFFKRITKFTNLWQDWWRKRIQKSNKLETTNNYKCQKVWKFMWNGQTARKILPKVSQKHISGSIAFKKSWIIKSKNSYCKHKVQMIYQTWQGLINLIFHKFPPNSSTHFMWQV